MPGGGTALLYASKTLNGLTGENADQDAGVNIVRALQAPIRQIVRNCRRRRLDRCRQTA